MRAAYAATWREGDGPLTSGRVELGHRALLLVDARGGAAPVRELPFDEVESVRVGRVAADRLGDLPTIVVEPLEGPTLRIATVVQPGALVELAERLADLRLGGPPVRRLAVVVPLKPDMELRARALVEHGPPFRPGGVGLTGHDVYVGHGSVVFTFASLEEGVLDRIAVVPGALAAAAEWHDLVDGPPEVAECAYHWQSPDLREPVGRIGLGF